MIANTRGLWRACVLVLALGLATPVVAAGDPAPVASTTAAIPQRIATADFAARPLISQPVLSPDGTHLAARFSVNGETKLAIADLTGQTPMRVLGMSKRNDLVRYFWAGNRTLLVSIGRTVPWYDDESYATRMQAYDLDTHKLHPIEHHIAGLKGDDVLWVNPDGQTMPMAFQDSIYDYPKL